MRVPLSIFFLMCLLSGVGVRHAYQEFNKTYTAQLFVGTVCESRIECPGGGLHIYNPEIGNANAECQMCLEKKANENWKALVAEPNVEVKSLKPE